MPQTLTRELAHPESIKPAYDACTHEDLLRQWILAVSTAKAPLA